jgi:hypothetical protein
MRTYPPQNVRSAEDVISQAYREQPNLRLAITPAGNVIGSWSESLGRFVIVASLTLTGEWVSMPYEILINGEAPCRDWAEVGRV